MTGQSLEAIEIRDILRLLPHRYPFVMVDRIIEINGDESGIGIKNVTINEPQFLGHFPENPVMPGVLMIEGMAQTAAVLVLRQMPMRETRVAIPVDYRQSQISKAGRAGRSARVPCPQIRQSAQHVVVSRRSQGRRRFDCRGRRRRRDHRGQIVIDPTARVADGARIGEGVEIGPYCIVGPQVELCAGARLVAHVHLTGVTVIGEGTVVYPFASLGTPPQSVHYRGGATRLRYRSTLRSARRRHDEYGHRRWRRAHQCRRTLHVHGRLSRRSRLPSRRFGNFCQQRRYRRSRLNRQSHVSRRKRGSSSVRAGRRGRHGGGAVRDHARPYSIRVRTRSDRSLLPVSTSLGYGGVERRGQTCIERAKSTANYS